MHDWYEMSLFGSLNYSATDDFDSDGLDNGEEMEILPGYLDIIDPAVWMKSNPAEPDSDFDGMDDLFETTNSFLDPMNPADALEDEDHDQLSNVEEYLLGTDILDWDTDNDYLPDGAEVEMGTNPKQWDSMYSDNDNDGLVLEDEYRYGTNPNAGGEDTDGDGVDDGDEVAQGSDPANGADGGIEPSPDEIVELTITVGDHSGSDSEVYELKMEGERSIRLHSGDYGNLASKTFKFIRGNSYTVTLKHIGTDPEFLAQYGEPDYDYTLTIEPPGAAGAQATSSGDDWVPGDPGQPPEVSAARSSAPSSDGIILEDAAGILGAHGESTYFFAENKEMKVHALGIDIECLDVGDLPKDRIRIGVCEKVKLTCKPAALGAVSWSIDGDGAISSGSGDYIQYTAHDRASTPTITATCAGAETDVKLYVVEPSGVYQEQVGNTIHLQGQPSAGFNGVSYLMPMDVSFANILINEGTCFAIATGCYAPKDGFEHPVWVEWAEVSSGNAQKGCMVEGPNESVDGTVLYDLVFLAHTIDWQGDAGSFLWNIPWEYKSTGGTAKEFATLVQFGQTEAGTGKTTISKGGVSVSAELNDPSCGSL